MNRSTLSQRLPSSLQEEEHTPDELKHAANPMAYPIIHKISPGPDNRTTATLFGLALDEYNKKLPNSEPKYKLEWKTSKRIIVPISLGKDINSDKQDENGFYAQSPRVTDYLNFYTRNCYEDPDPKKSRQMTAVQQKEVLDFIKNNCYTKDDYYIITHVDRAIVVKKVPVPEELPASATFRPNRF